MIKVKILNYSKGRNEPTFRYFALTQQYFNNTGIEFTNSDNFDFIFVGMEDFLFKNLPLDESIQKGIEFVEQYGSKAFLFDGSDSTSLLGSYEVLANSNAKFLFKNQLLKNREDYLKQTPFNKIFFEGESKLKVGYDISEANWERIKLSGFNLGNILTDYHNFKQVSFNKDHDICAIYQGILQPNQDHGVDNHIFYTNHRTKAWEILNTLTQYSTATKKLPKGEFLNLMANSKVALSPFGMGEICFRDFELMQYGTIMIKPSMDHLQTIPNPYIAGETYVSVKHDWSNLEEVLEDVVDNYFEYQEVVSNFRDKFKQMYTPTNFADYWLRIFNNL